MRPPRAPYLLSSVLVSFFLSVSVFAQQANRNPEAKPPSRNIFRTNLTSMAFRNYEFQYEPFAGLSSKVIRNELNYLTQAE